MMWRFKKNLGTKLFFLVSEIIRYSSQSVAWLISPTLLESLCAANGVPPRYLWYSYHLISNDGHSLTRLYWAAQHIRTGSSEVSNSLSYISAIWWYWKISCKQSMKLALFLSRNVNSLVNSCRIYQISAGILDIVSGTIVQSMFSLCVKRWDPWIEWFSAVLILRTNALYQNRILSIFLTIFGVVSQLIEIHTRDPNEDFR